MWPNQQLPHGGLSQALLTWIQNLKFKTHTETQTVNTYSWSNTTFLCLQYILPIYLISNSKSNYQCWIVCNISLWTCRVANLLMGCGLSDICLWTCWGVYLLMVVWHCQAGAGVPVVPLKALQTGHVELALTLALSRYNPQQKSFDEQLGGTVSWVGLAGPPGIGPPWVVRQEQVSQ